MLPNKNEGRVKIRAGRSSEGNSRVFTRQIGWSRRNLRIVWCQIWRKRLTVTRGHRAECVSHTNSITSSGFLVGAFSTEAFKSWVEMREIQKSDWQQFGPQSLTWSEEKQTKTLRLMQIIPISIFLQPCSYFKTQLKQFVWVAAWISSA